MTLYLVTLCLSTLHVTHGLGENTYNTYKNLLMIDPNLSKCHWSCPFHAERLCAHEPHLNLYRVFLNSCFLELHNSCFDKEYIPLTKLSMCKNNYTYPKEMIEYLKDILNPFPRVIPKPLEDHVQRHGRRKPNGVKLHRHKVDHKDIKVQVIRSK